MESWVVYHASLIYVHIIKNNNIMFILDVSDLFMGIVHRFEYLGFIHVFMEIQYWLSNTYV
jgi:hypothetical protein